MLTGDRLGQQHPSRRKPLRVPLGAVLLALSVALGISAFQYAAPAGNVSMAPTATEWPVEIRRSVGNVDLDFTTHPLPGRGTALVPISEIQTSTDAVTVLLVGVSLA